MFKKMKSTYYNFGAAFTAGMISSSQAKAGNNFNKITENIMASISDIPGMITGLAYLFGILLAVLGVMKIKDHVENPTQTPLKDGLIRLLCGGGLLTVPIITEAMQTTIGDGAGVDGASIAMQKVTFTVE